MITLRFIQITAADHTKTFAIFFAEIFCRQTEKHISQCDFIQFNALTICNDIIIVIIIAYGRNNNMVERKVIIPGELFQAPVAVKKKSEYNRVIKIYNTSPVMKLTAEVNGRIKGIAFYFAELFSRNFIRKIFFLTDNTEYLF